MLHYDSSIAITATRKFPAALIALWAGANQLIVAVKQLALGAVALVL